MADRKRVTFWMDEKQRRALDGIKNATGVKKSDQLRRALDMWISACKPYRLDVHLRDGTVRQVIGRSPGDA